MWNYSTLLKCNDIAETTTLVENGKRWYIFDIVPVQVVCNMYCCCQWQYLHCVLLRRSLLLVWFFYLRWIRVVSTFRLRIAYDGRLWTVVAMFRASLFDLGYFVAIKGGNGLLLGVKTFLNLQVCFVSSRLPFAHSLSTRGYGDADCIFRMLFAFPTHTIWLFKMLRTIQVY